MNGFIKANLVSMTSIDVVVFSNAQFDDEFKLYIEDKFAYSPRVVRKTANKDLYLFHLELKNNFDFSKRYYLSLSNFPLQLVDVSLATEFNEFDELFYYDGELGPIYNKKETSFALWAPLSPQVKLKIQDEENHFVIYEMTRDISGVHHLILKGDYKNKLYSYLIENNGIVRESIDIYAKGGSINSEYSAVIDLEEIKQKFPHVDFKNKDLRPAESIIYETNVRDFTEGKGTNIVEKGKYLGFVEENRLTTNKHPAGIDYLSYLGITHVQLQPVSDVNNVDETNIKKQYNWGYDPCHYFVLEGAYSSHPEIPNARIEEFKILVNKLHERNIGVIVDVVYNHCFDYLNSCFEKTVPNYYFRKKKDGTYSSISGCGNDLASEKPMVKKLIIDNIKYLFEMFDIDGMRFDLMGLFNIQTMKDIEDEIRKIKPNAFLYGEGWNMGLQIPENERANLNNANQLINYSFFNDMFRDIVKGPNFRDRIKEKGFINGDINYWHGLEYVMNGSVLDVSYEHRFLNANQSINYVECHDNNTLFDKLNLSNPDEDSEILYARVRLANEIILLSFGVPFFHMGQEIGQSKLGLDNTYNVIKINNMDWSLVDKNFEMVDQFVQDIKIRKKCEYLKLVIPDDIKDIYHFEQLDNDLLKIKINQKINLNNYHDLEIYINITNKPLKINFDDYRKILVVLEKENPTGKLIQINPTSLIITYK